MRAAWLAACGACVASAAASWIAPRRAWGTCDPAGGETSDCVAVQGDWTGTVDFFATGASFAVIDDPADDRPGDLLMIGEVAIPERRIRPRANLVAAYLYFGGSLFIDQDAVETPDLEVEIQVPGSDAFTAVRGEMTRAGRDYYQSGAIPGFGEVFLYTARADITKVLRDAGGKMAGAYRVRAFEGDILYRGEKHTVANASFSIIVIFEEPLLAPRKIVLFDGMQEVLGSTISLDLGGFLVSPRPSGSLTFYAMEGDCNPGPTDCEMGDNRSGAERVRVIGQDPTRTITLSDEVNPRNDVFNRTINTVDPPIHNVPGTDIDTFNITGALRSGDTAVKVEVTAPRATNGQTGELVGIAYVIVGIDVFAPELRVDSRISIATERGDVQESFFPGDPLRVAIAVSNTGNLEASGVRVVAEMPELVTGVEIAEEPEGATVAVTQAANGRSVVTVEGLGVRHGDANDVVLLVGTRCPLPEGGTLVMTATIGAPAEGGVAFTKTASVAISGRDRCGPRFYLYGGGGCSASGGVGSALVVLGLIALWLGRRRASWLAVLLIGCATEVDPAQPDAPPPAVFGVSCPDHEDGAIDDMIVVPSIAGRAPYCIDRYEASLDDAKVEARSRRFTLPARGVTWSQARDACGAVGKRLCTADEWLTACRGDQDQTYPYGETFEPTSCNGFAAGRGDAVETGAMIIRGADDLAAGCVTQHGAYDLSGNVWEWNATEYLDGARRGLAGGSFRSNAIGLRCVAQDNHAVPGEVDDAYGFRCCIDLP